MKEILKKAKKWIKAIVSEAMAENNREVSDCENCELMADCADNFHCPHDNVLKSAVKSPANCTETELTLFCDMLCKAGTLQGQSIDGIVNLARRAEKLAFLRDDDGNLIGIAALKHPRKSYVNRIGAPKDTLELGWFYIVPGFRSFSRAVRLISGLLKHVGKDVFFTTKNNTIAAIAKRVGFKLINTMDSVKVLHLDYSALQGIGKVKAIYDRWVNAG